MSQSSWGHTFKTNPCVDFNGAGKLEHFFHRNPCCCRIITLFKCDWSMIGIVFECAIYAVDNRRKFCMSFSSYSTVEFLVIQIGCCCYSRFGWRISYRYAWLQLLLRQKYTAHPSYCEIFRNAPSVSLEILVCVSRCGRLRWIELPSDSRFQRLRWPSLWNVWRWYWTTVQKRAIQTSAKGISKEE